MKLILLSLSLLFNTCAYGAQGPNLALIKGVYKGVLFNGDDLDPVLTTFNLSDSGRLTGEYVIDDETGIFYGVLSSMRIEDSHTLGWEWTDKDGEGYLRIEFTEDFQKFSGYWGDRVTDSRYQWDGEK